MVVSIISGIITFLAVVIALFKDDIQEQWRRPRVEFDFPSEKTVEDLNSSVDLEGAGETIKANRYVSRVEILNKGNLPALNAEVYLEKLTFTPKNTSISQNIECSSSALEWKGTESTSIIIPPGGRKIVSIAEVSAPENVSTPGAEGTENHSRLVIGSIVSDRSHNDGKWVATFGLYAQNHKPVNICVEIEWTGTWKNRLTEFNSQYKIEKAKG